MTILPVVERELRVSARKPRVYWARFFAAGVAMVMVLWIWTSFGPRRQDVLSKELFGSVAFMAFAYAAFSGVALTADAISEEKREGTLGLLFLTDLKGYDVVLGKVFATSLNAFYGLLAIFPVMAITLLLGGVTIGEFWRMVLVLVNTLLFSVSLGILVSTASRHERKAQFATLGLILLIAGGLPLLGDWIEGYIGKPGSMFLVYPSPGFSIYMAFDQSYMPNPRAFWISIGSVAAIWLASLILAGRIVRTAWHDRPRTSWRLNKSANSLTRKIYRSRLLDVNPVYWLASRNPSKPLYVWAFLGLAALFWIWLYLRHPHDVLDSASCLFTGFMLQAVLKIWVASDAGRMLAEDRKSGALELTLSTPLTVREILDGQFLALFRQFGWAASTVIMIDIALLFCGQNLMSQGDREHWIVTGLAGMIIFVADLFVLPWSAMWLSLVSPKAGKAFALTVVYLLVLPWLGFFGFLTIAVSANAPDGLVIGAWFSFALIIDFIVFIWASTNLKERFREVVTQRFSSPASS